MCVSILYTRILPVLITNAHTFSRQVPVILATLLGRFSPFS